MIAHKDGFFEKVFDSLPEGVILLDLSFKIIDLNDAAQSMLKVSKKKAVGKPLLTFVSSSEMEEFAAKALSEERSLYGEEMKVAFRFGGKMSLLPVASPLYSEDGIIEGVLVQLKDVQATKFLSMQNTQHSRASSLEALFLGLAHELKNPLSGIRGAAQLLLSEENEGEANFSANIIIKEVERLTSLIDRLKKLEPYTKEDFEKLDVNEILHEMEYLESRSTQNHHISFELNLDVALPHILGDRNALKQAFLNIFKNSIQAIRERGVVGITTRWISDYKLNGQNTIGIEFTDDGVGIPQEEIQKIFNPFYSTKEGGSGLGLFLAFQIIAKHGGAIIVESEPGAGTTVDVNLPVPD